MRSRLPALLVVVIVAASVIAGLVAGAQRDDRTGPVDLVVLNGRVFTGAGREPAEAIAVRGNEILRVGSNREIKALAGAATPSRGRSARSRRRIPAAPGCSAGAGTTRPSPAAFPRGSNWTSSCPIGRPT